MLLAVVVDFSVGLLETQGEEIDLREFRASLFIHLKGWIMVFFPIP